MKKIERLNRSGEALHTMGDKVDELVDAVNELNRVSVKHGDEVKFNTPKPPVKEPECEPVKLIAGDGGFYAIYKTFSGWGEAAEDAYRELCVALSLVIEVQEEKPSKKESPKKCPHGRYIGMECVKCNPTKKECEPSLALRLMRVMYNTPDSMLTSNAMEELADEARKWAVEVVKSMPTIGFTWDIKKDRQEAGIGQEAILERLKGDKK